MNENDPRLPLEDWLRAAYTGNEAGCPPPEAFLEAETATPEERRRLDEHAGRCPACAAERDLARLFATAPEEAGVSGADLDFVVARLEDASPVRATRAAGQVVPFRIPTPPPTPAPAPAARSATSQPWAGQLWKIAAALVLVLGGGLLFQLTQSPQGGPPSLPAPQVGGPVRGGEMETISPSGDVGEIPVELRWTPREGARLYRVRLSAVDDTVLWEGTVPAPPARLPAEVTARLHRAVSYTWTVEALDASGARIAASEPARFRARPQP
jgi:hypothetical protein